MLITLAQEIKVNMSFLQVRSAHGFLRCDAINHRVELPKFCQTHVRCALEFKNQVTNDIVSAILLRYQPCVVTLMA